MFKKSFCRKFAVLLAALLVPLCISLLFACNPVVGPTGTDPTSTDDPGSNNTGTSTGPVIDNGTVEEQGAVQFVSYTGWFEYAFASWNPVSGAVSYQVSVQAGDAAYVPVDEELIREADGIFRVDIPGLKGGIKHNIKVEPMNASGSAGTASVVSLTPTAHTREGFAFVNGTTSGGYEADGTVAADTLILYVNEANKDTITADVTKGSTTASYTGLGAIMAARQSAKSEAKLIVRFMGRVTPPAGVDSASLMNIKANKNVTFEGIGDDVLLYGWGLNLREASNIEVRNLAFEGFPDDSVSIQVDNDHIWVHHNDFFWGANGGGDKSKGDGSCDIKDDSTYITISYNHFYNTGKSSLCGMKSESTGVGFVSYHHNWFDESGSRHPRVRTITVHVYNNYFDHNYSAGIASTTASSVFVENNYFEDVVRPMITASQGHSIKEDGTDFNSGENGGVIKEFGNIFSSCGGTNTYINGDLQEITLTCSGCIYWNSGRSIDTSQAAKDWPDAYAANTRNEQVPASFYAYKGGATYNNFDTAESMYSYAVQTPLAAKSTVMQFAGRFGNGSAPDEDGMNDAQKVAFTKTAFTSALSGLFFTDAATTEAAVQAVIDDTSVVKYATVSFLSDLEAGSLSISFTSGEETDTLVIRSHTAAEKIALVRVLVEAALSAIVYTDAAETRTAVDTVMAAIELGFADVSIEAAVLDEATGTISVSVSCADLSEQLELEAPSAAERLEITRALVAAALEAVTFTVDDSADTVLTAVQAAYQALEASFAYQTSVSASIIDGDVQVTISSSQDAGLSAVVRVNKPSDAAYAAAAKAVVEAFEAAVWDTDAATTAGAVQSAIDAAVLDGALYGATVTVEQEAEAVSITITYGEASDSLRLSAFTGYVHSFTESGKTSDFFSITGNTSNSKGTVSYAGQSLTICLKMESSTNISFTNPLQDSLQLTLVFGGDTSALNKQVKVDGQAVDIIQNADGNEVAVVSVAPGAHSITKDDSINLFYIKLDY